MEAARSWKTSSIGKNGKIMQLDERIRYELELQADSEWLALAVVADDLVDLISLDEAEAELAALESDNA
jgi:hypothetical protein